MIQMRNPCMFDIFMRQCDGKYNDIVDGRLWPATIMLWLYTYRKRCSDYFHEHFCCYFFRWMAGAARQQATIWTNVDWGAWRHIASLTRTHWVHDNDALMSAMASQITSHTIVYPTVYSGADEESIKAPRHWPLWGEITGDRWIARTKGQ